MNELSNIENKTLKGKVLESLANWIIQTANKKGLATPEEIAALPKVAEVFLKNYY